MVITELKRVGHLALRQVGVEIHLTRNLKAAIARERAEKEWESWRFLRHFDLRTVFDVGANEGQFAILIHALCPDAHIYSFEPLPDVYSKLQRQFATDDRITPVNCGLSDRKRIAIMNRSAYTPSSSILPMASMHRNEFPQSVEHTVVSVQLERLDDWVDTAGVALEGELLVKLDVQGHEDAVIRGGERAMRRARLAIIEVSFFELYEGQALFDSIYRQMADLGYLYRGSLNQHYSRKVDRILFADAIFENIRPEIGPMVSEPGDNQGPPAQERAG